MSQPTRSSGHYELVAASRWILNQALMPVISHLCRPKGLVIAKIMPVIASEKSG